MPFNINNFKANIRDFGYLDTNSFALLVQPPQFLAGLFGGSQTRMAENMSFRIDQVRAPGISLISADINRYAIGPTQKQPYNAQFQELYFSILLDHKCELWHFWYEWLRKIFEFNGTPGGLAPSYLVDYKETYASTVQVQIFDHYGALVETIDLFEAFPTAIREIPLAWADPNLMKLNVSMSYTEYTMKKESRQAATQRVSGLNTEVPQRESVLIT